MRRSKTAETSRLERLEIEDFALIERADVHFSVGLTAFTGETGSGKTMLLGALGVALGERATDVVREGAPRARVTLTFEPGAVLRELLEADGFGLDASEPATFAREMVASGKTTARINGRAATAAQLRAYGEYVVDRIGQHEQQRLLSPAYQLAAVDAFAGEAARGPLAAVAQAFDRLRGLDEQMRDAESRYGRAVAESEFARFALGEIDVVAPVAGEDEALRERRDYLSNVERIGLALGRAHEALALADGNAGESLGIAAAAMRPIGRYATALQEFAERLGALHDEANDVAAALARERDAAEFDRGELERVSERLDRLDRLKKKYGATLDEVLAAREGFAERIEAEATQDEREARTRVARDEAQADLERAAAALGAARASAATSLETRIAGELAGLAMPNARFAVVLEPLGHIARTGAEYAAFALAPHAGEALRPLGRAASGGELSRVLLALAVVLADRRERTALVFDEIDAGIGGATATAVGERLGKLSRGAQVVCVTHLAQLASWADRHYALRKNERRGAARIDAVLLDAARDVPAEIARMLSGATDGVALDHASALVGDVAGAKARSAGRPVRG